MIKISQVNKYLNNTIDCACGRKHHVPIKEVIIKENALIEVPDLLEKLTNLKKVYLVVDKNTQIVAGNKLRELLLAEYEVETILLTGESVVPDPESLFTILHNIDDDGYLIACGSGTINDLCKYISSKQKRPYMIVATAPSMDGYTSSVAPLTIKGVKQTYEVDPPEAVVADLNVLQAAPWEMIQAGFGDLLGKVTSLLDWQLSHILFDEYYCADTADLVKTELDKMIIVADKLKERDPESIAILTRGLVYSGLAMLMIGNSRPASGSEHHFSHFLEMYGLMFAKHLPPHGVKVGLGVSFTSQFYLRLQELDFSDLRVTINQEERKKEIKDNYLSRAEPILHNLKERYRSNILSSDKLRDKEIEIKQLITNFSQYLGVVKELLFKIGIMDRQDVQEIKIDWLEKALKYGFEIRSRYTVVALLNEIGFLQDLSQELIAEWEKEV